MDLQRNILVSVILIVVKLKWNLYWLMWGSKPVMVWRALRITLDMRTLFQTKYRFGRKESYALSQRWIGEEERLSRCTLSHHKQDKSCHQWWEQHCALIFNSVNLRKTCLCFHMKEDGKQVELNTEVTRSKTRRY